MRMLTAVEPDIATVSALIGDPSRAAILMALADGRALPAGELARFAHVTPQTASSHLDKLFKGNLLAIEIQGRHHYYRLRDERIAGLLESLARLAPPRRPLTVAQQTAAQTLRFARTCYGHLAGQLGVAIAQALFKMNVLDTDDDSQWRVTLAGSKWLGDLGLDIDVLRRERRPLLKRCLDWSERRHHLAGSLGVAIARLLFERNWVIGVRRSRALRLTDSGRAAIRRQFGVEL
jgi:DNA-binding transcriptional ArsR family regulator